MPVRPPDHVCSLYRWCHGNRAHLDCGSSLVQVKKKHFKIGICCLSAKNTAVRSKSKDLLSWNQNNMSEWSNMSTCRLLFQ